MVDRADDCTADDLANEVPLCEAAYVEGRKSGSKHWTALGAEAVAITRDRCTDNSGWWSCLQRAEWTLGLRRAANEDSPLEQAESESKEEGWRLERASNWISLVCKAPNREASWLPDYWRQRACLDRAVLEVLGYGAPKRAPISHHARQRHEEDADVELGLDPAPEDEDTRRCERYQHAAAKERRAPLTRCPLLMPRASIEQAALTPKGLAELMEIRALTARHHRQAQDASDRAKSQEMARRLASLHAALGSLTWHYIRDSLAKFGFTSSVPPTDAAGGPEVRAALTTFVTDTLEPMLGRGEPAGLALASDLRPHLWPELLARLDAAVAAHLDAQLAKAIATAIAKLQAGDAHAAWATLVNTRTRLAPAWERQRNAPSRPLADLLVGLFAADFGKPGTPGRPASTRAAMTQLLPWLDPKERAAQEARYAAKDRAVTAALKRLGARWPLVAAFRAAVDPDAPPEARALAARPEVKALIPWLDVTLRGPTGTTECGAAMQALAALPGTYRRAAVTGAPHRTVPLEVRGA